MHREKPTSGCCTRCRRELLRNADNVADAVTPHDPTCEPQRLLRFVDIGCANDARFEFAQLVLEAKYVRDVKQTAHSIAVGYKAGACER